jgi:enoyl-CoA hydratase
MAYETLLVEYNENVTVLTLNRPKVLNALNAALLRELDEAIQALAADDTVRAIVLRGAGGKAFAAGADISELAEADAAAGEQVSSRTQRIFRRIETLGKPVLACIDGYALGGGCELAMACALRLANEAARLGQPEIKLGLIPGYGGSQRLPRLVGRGAALKLLLTGAIIDAGEAFRIGLIDELVPGGSEALLARAVELARSIARMPPLAIAATIEAVDEGADKTLDEGLALESRIFGRLCGTEDKREGTRAFLEKRTPVWIGR